MTSETATSTAPYVLAYDGIEPQFAAAPSFCEPGASVLGRAQIGFRAILGAASVIRADGHFVQIGDDFRLGENSTVHISHGLCPTIVGNRVTIGRNAVAHACTVGNDCVIEDGAVILDGSTIEEGVLIEACSVVYPRSTLEAGLVYAGSPAKPVRKLSAAEREEREAKLHEGVAASLFEPDSRLGGPIAQQAKDVFVARTARLVGRADLRSRSSVFFSCVLDAGPGSIVLGDNSNIQDNTQIRCSRDGIIIGRNTTIGHNVQLQDCIIGEACLVGIGSAIAPGTIVEDDVLLAAGSVTEPGQVIQRGWLWAGRPARPISRLNDAKRAMMRVIVEQYCAYGAVYRQLQQG